MNLEFSASEIATGIISLILLITFLTTLAFLVSMCIYSLIKKNWEIFKKHNYVGYVCLISFGFLTMLLTALFIFDVQI
jgi:hypothetical protein